MEIITKIKNQKYKIKNTKGFTLIEILVVMAILAILGAVSTEVVLSILKSSNKTTIINEAKQNGSFVLDTFEKDARGAKKVEYIASGIRFTMIDDSTLDYTCVNIAGTSENNYIARNNAALTNKDPEYGINVLNPCVFTISSSPATIRFSFTLTESKNKAALAAGRQEFKITTSFDTTITLRN